MRATETTGQYYAGKLLVPQIYHAASSQRFLLFRYWTKQIDERPPVSNRVSATDPWRAVEIIEIDTGYVFCMVVSIISLIFTRPLLVLSRAGSSMFPHNCELRLRISTPSLKSSLPKSKDFLDIYSRGIPSISIFQSLAFPALTFSFSASARLSIGSMTVLSFPVPSSLDTGTFFPY